MNDQVNRCSWCLKDPIYIQYHDEEWGIPVHDDRQLFEMLILEGAQAGLSWWTVLQKRERYREVFDQFNAEKIARYDEAKVEALLADSGIIRNKLKVRSTITNAQNFLRIQEEYGSFDQFIWQFTNHKTIQNAFTEFKEVPAKTPVSDAMSKALRKQGFKFVGSTICYAYMQATGMVNDHVKGCFRYESRT